jgi:carbon storage regulator CsrA
VRIFFQGKGESVIINDEITVTVIELDGDEVILGVDAPEWMELGEIEIGSSEEEARLSNPLRPR